MASGDVCGFCGRGDEAVDVCGVLHVDQLADGEIVSAHHKCMQYSALLTQYKSAQFGGFKVNSVKAEIQRGKKLKCSICKGKSSKGHLPKRGATAGCALRRCAKTYHFYCAAVADTVITKRLVVDFKNKKKSAVLYRVFCCKDHKVNYIQGLKTDKDELFPGNESDSTADDEEWEDWREFQDLAENPNDVSYYNMDATDSGSGSSPQKTQSAKRKVANKDSKTSSSKRAKKSASKLPRNSGNDTDSSVGTFLIDQTADHFKLPKRFAPVVMLSQIDSQPDRGSPTMSSYSADTMTSLGTVSNGCSTPDLMTKLPSVVRNIDLTQPVTDVPADTVAICILGDLEMAAYEQEKLLSLVQSRYNISQHSIYMWHEVINKHCMNSRHMIHFMSDLTENLLDRDVETMVQSLICPQSRGLLEKYNNILIFQDKLEASIRVQLDQGMCKMVYKSLKKLGDKLGRTVGEVLPVDEDCVLVLLINDKLAGAEHLLQVFSPGQASIRGDNSDLLLYPISVELVSRTAPPAATDMQDELRKLIWWCVANIQGPVRLEVLPLERQVLCASDHADTSLAFHISQFLNKMYTLSWTSAAELTALCVVTLDQGVLDTYEYLRRVLKSFLEEASTPRFAFVDLNGVDTYKLLTELTEIAQQANKYLELLCTVDPDVRRPATVILKASDQPPLTHTVPVRQQFISARSPVCLDHSTPKRNPSKPKTIQVVAEMNPVALSTPPRDPSGARYVEDGEVPSTSKQTFNGKKRNTPRLPRASHRIGDQILNI